MINKYIIAIAIFVLLLVVGVAAWVLFLGNPLLTTEPEQTGPIVIDRPASDLAETFRKGDYAGSIDEYEELIANADSLEELSPSEKAIAKYNLTSLYYKETGDIEDLFRSIREQKAIVEDPETPERERARTMNAIGAVYCTYGRDARILPELYSGKYEQYYQGDPSLASRRVHEDSYKIYETPKAAVYIAHWYAKELLSKPDLDPSIKAGYVQKTEEWLAEAEKQAEIELTRTELIGTYIESRRYVSYLYWRAFTIGALADAVGGDYRDTYRQVFADFYEFVESKNNHTTYQYLPYAKWIEAVLIDRIEGEREEAVRLLDEAVQLVLDDPRPEINEFVISLHHFKNDTVGSRGDFLWQAWIDAGQISPAFQQFIDDIDNAIDVNVVNTEEGQ